MRMHDISTGRNGFGVNACDQMPPSPSPRPRLAALARCGGSPRRSFPLLILTLSVCLLTFASCFCVYAQRLVPPRADENTTAIPASAMPPELREVGIDQHLNQAIPQNLIFRDETGRAVRLGEYFSAKPVILALVYYECPMLCTQVLNGIVGSLKALSFDIGKEFDVLSVSIDPRETPALANAKKGAYIGRYGRKGSSAGWHMLTGEKGSIDALTSAVGFRYTFDQKTNQFAHAAGIMVLTPQGRLSHYFYGIEYAPKDLRLALVEASANKIGSPVDQLLLYCYHYNPATGKYGAVVMNIIRVGGLATLLGLALLVAILRRGDARRRRQKERAKRQKAESSVSSFCLVPSAFSYCLCSLSRPPQSLAAWTHSTSSSWPSVFFSWPWSRY